MYSDDDEDLVQDLVPYNDVKVKSKTTLSVCNSKLTLTGKPCRRKTMHSFWERGPGCCFCYIHSTMEDAVEDFMYELSKLLSEQKPKEEDGRKWIYIELKKFIKKNKYSYTLDDIAYGANFRYVVSLFEAKLK